MIELLRDPKVKNDQGNVIQVLQDSTGKDFEFSRERYLEWWEKTGRSEYEVPKRD